MRLDRLLRQFRASSPGLAECRGVRGALEPSLCLDAARLCDAADATALRQIVAAMQHRADDPAALLSLNWELHRRIAAIAANALLRTLYLTVLHCVEEGTGGEDPAAAVPAAEALAVHEELVEALIDGGGHRLERAVKRHAPLCA